MLSPLELIYRAMDAAGVNFDGAIQLLPGQTQRFTNLNKTKRNQDVCVYVYPSLRWAKFWVYGEIDRQALRLSNAALTSADHVRIKAHETKQRWQRLAGCHQANILWQRSEPAEPEHPYLRRKQITPSFCRQLGDDLIIPLSNIEGIKTSAQLITPSGNKWFIPGAQMGASFTLIGHQLTHTVRFTEGFATAKSIHMASDDLTVACFSASNIEAVLKVFMARFPHVKPVICADQGRAGISYAQRAARSVGHCDILTPLDRTGNVLTTINDFNDLHVQEGLEAVEGQLHRIYFTRISGL